MLTFLSLSSPVCFARIYNSVFAATTPGSNLRNRLTIIIITIILYYWAPRQMDSSNPPI